MIDRSKYTAYHAPPADELVQRWTEKLPTAAEVERFFLHELCESSEHEYFLCVSDLFLDVVSRQDGDEQIQSLSILVSRLLDAAEFARGVKDQDLVEHFNQSIKGFVELYGSCISPVQSGSGWKDRHVFTGYLALQAVAMGELPLARMIAYGHREMVCTNPDCDEDGEIQCPGCDAYMIPYEYHTRFHNMRNASGHPPDHE